METSSDLKSVNATKSKSTVSQSGHAKNVANFQNLISFVSGYGPIYNPAKKALQLPQLNALLTASQTSLINVIAKKTVYSHAVNERTIAFSDLKALSTRLTNALETTDATDEKIKNAKSYSRKIQGQRASAIPVVTDESKPAAKTNAIKQQSYDYLIQHFTGLISVLQSESSYAPNESELKIETLTAKLADLIAKNSAIATAYTNISNTRLERNDTLYGTDAGLVDVAIEVKKYIKSIFGATSPQFAQVNGIQFKTQK
jgi:hypothetical protein